MISSFVNLYIITKIKYTGDFSFDGFFIFIFNRGLSCLIICVCLVIISGQFNKLYKINSSLYRFVFGGTGLSLSLWGAVQMSPIGYVITQRLEIIFLARKSRIAKTYLTIIILLIFFTLNLYSEIFGSYQALFWVGLGTILVSVSKILQITSIKTEPTFLLPAAPALALIIIGIFGLVFMKEMPIFNLDGLLSGLAMAITYYASIKNLITYPIWHLAIIDAICAIGSFIIFL